MTAVAGAVPIHPVAAADTATTNGEEPNSWTVDSAYASKATAHSTDSSAAADLEDLSDFQFPDLNLSVRIVSAYFCQMVGSGRYRDCWFGRYMQEGTFRT